MRYFPLFLDMRGRTVLLAGGGEAMAQKARLVGRTEAALTVMAPAPGPELSALIAAGRAMHVPQVYDRDAVAAAHVVFAATGCVGIDAMIAAEAGARGAVVNVVDRPALCTALTPAIVDRDPLVIAIGTEGTAPVLAREIRAGLEARLDPGLGDLAALCGRMRGMVADGVPDHARRGFWQWVFAGPARRLWDAGRRAEAEAMIAAQAAAGGPGGAARLCTLVAIPAAPDLLALRALSRLQTADLVLHPPGAAAELLDLARRDAARGPLAEAAGRLPAARAAVCLVTGDTAGLAETAAALGFAIERIGEGAQPSVAGVM